VACVRCNRGASWLSFVVLQKLLEAAHAKAFLAHLTVEALDVRVLRRLARLDVVQIDCDPAQPGRLSNSAQSIANAVLANATGVT
jgi:hypothetical protein